MLIFSLRKVVQLVGVQKGESFKKITKTKGGPERESVKKSNNKYLSLLGFIRSALLASGGIDSYP
jgi:hypothetical protein